MKLYRCGDEIRVALSVEEATDMAKTIMHMATGQVSEDVSLPEILAYRLCWLANPFYMAEHAGMKDCAPYEPNWGDD